MMRFILIVGVVAAVAMGAVSLSADPVDDDGEHSDYHSLGPCLSQSNPLGFCEWSCVMDGHSGADACCNNYCQCN